MKCFLATVNGWAAVGMLVVCLGHGVSAEETSAEETSAVAADQVVNVRDCGARGDGRTDDQFAFVKALNEAKAAGKAVYVPAGRYAHSGVLVLDGVELYGDGDSSELRALSPHLSALFLKGKQPALRNVRLTTSVAGVARQETQESAMVCPWKAEGFRIDNVTIEGAGSVGILNYGGFGTPAQYAEITRCRIRGTLADGIHNTFGAHHVRVSSNEVVESGDDGIAVVSYADDGVICTDIDIQENRVANVIGGRGIAAVGGLRVLIAKNEISNTYGAGIYLMSEPSYITYGVHQIEVEGNRIQNACLAPCETDHPGILVGGRPGSSRIVGGREAIANTVGNVTIRNNTIEMQRRLAIRVDAFSERIEIDNNRITGSIDGGIAVSDAARSARVGRNQISR